MADRLSHQTAATASCSAIRRRSFGYASPRSLEQEVGHDQLEGSVLERAEHLGRGAAGRQQTRDHDVRVEHPRTLRARAPPRGVLRLERERFGVPFGELAALHMRSSRSSPRSRRNASSMTSLSPRPVRAALSFTARRTDSSIVKVVRSFATLAS
jgi:hypothetical protein